ncbi:MAG: hypothetical protein K8R92_11980 [Planctomycetes bacterium]|nr:hypothetical protein [Planctomycetota bacterium]
MSHPCLIASTLLTLSFAGAASASVSGVQGLYGRNYIVNDAGNSYSVIDVFVKYNSNVGTGSNGERIVNFFGQATTDAATFGVNKISKFENNLGLPFQHSNISWLPGSGANGGTGNNTWDSFVTVGARTQGAGNTAGVFADPFFLNPNSNVGSIMGASNTNGHYIGAGFVQGNPLDPAFETNTSSNPDHMIMLGRFSLKASDIVANGGTPKMVVWCDFNGKSTAQTGGTTLYNLFSANVKSDAQTKCTTSAKIWNFTSSFDGTTSGQEAWTFAVPAPGASLLLGLSGLLLRRRNSFRNAR